MLNLEIRWQVVADRALATCDQPQLNGPIGSGITDALQLRTLNRSDHVVDLCCCFRLPSDKALGVTLSFALKLAKQFRRLRKRHAAHGAAARFYIEVTGHVLGK